MRDSKTERDVRTITTGHAEADMLGQVYLWVSERKNSKYAQRLHRKTYRRRPTMSIFRVVLEAIQTAPTACWRRLKSFGGKKDAQSPRYLSGVRKQNRNGN